VGDSKLLAILTTTVALSVLGACASLPPVGLYGLKPRSGDWVNANALTNQASRLIDTPELDLEQAEALLRQAIEADPTHGPAYLQLGIVLEQQERLDEAAITFAWARGLMPGYPEAERRLHMLLEQLEHHEETRISQ